MINLCRRAVILQQSRGARQRKHHDGEDAAADADDDAEFNDARFPERVRVETQRTFGERTDRNRRAQAQARINHVQKPFLLVRNPSEEGGDDWKRRAHGNHGAPIVPVRANLRERRLRVALFCFQQLPHAQSLNGHGQSDGERGEDGERGGELKIQRQILRVKRRALRAVQIALPTRDVIL